MGEAEFIGMLVLAAAILIGLMVSIITPMLKLNTSIVKLNDTIERLFCDNARQDQRLDKHGKEIDEIKGTVARHDTELIHLKKYHGE